MIVFQRMQDTMPLQCAERAEHEHRQTVMERPQEHRGQSYAKPQPYWPHRKHRKLGGGFFRVVPFAKLFSQPCIHAFLLNHTDP